MQRHRIVAAPPGRRAGAYGAGRSGGPLLLLALLALTAVACREEDPGDLLRARMVTTNHDLIGGPLSHGQIGDYVIENDQVRFIVSGPHHSWGPGLFGGTVVDADLRRPESVFRGGQGKDQFAELFPTVNLLTPDPTASEIEIVRDGADGKVAQIRVQGAGALYLDALSLLDPERADPLVAAFVRGFGLQTTLSFETTYTLRPGVRYLEIDTVVRRPQDPNAQRPTCAPLMQGCSLTCPGGFRTNAVKTADNTNDCLKCECDAPDPRELDLFTEPAPLLGQIMSDEVSLYPGLDKRRAGMVAGDFLFFGGRTDVFVPGLGFDEKGKVFENLDRNIDTITSPLTFDWIASVGEDVSYGLFTVRESTPVTCRHRVVLTRLLDPAQAAALQADLDAALGTNGRLPQSLKALREQRLPAPVILDIAEADLAAKVQQVQGIVGTRAEVGTEPDGDCRTPKLLAPLFTSSATLIASSGVACKLTKDDGTGKEVQDTSDDTTCDERRSFHYKRFLVVGSGDVATVAEPMLEAKGVATGSVRGIVFQTDTSTPVQRASVFAVRDPDATKTYATYEALVRANRAASGTAGVEVQALCDVGTDPKRVGSYRMALPPGRWYLVARTEGGVVSVPVPVVITAGGKDIVHLVVRAPGVLQYRVTQTGAGGMPAKLTIQAIEPGAEGVVPDGPLSAAEEATLAPHIMHADGKRRVELGTSRFDDGIFKVVYSATGRGEVPLEAGAYRVTASRGFEYSIQSVKVTVTPAHTEVADFALTHEVDSTGWISGDFHLHAEPSFDSGIDLGLRVLTNVTEGVELISSSDHDAITDYKPSLLAQGLDRWATSQVGIEVSTLEIGHFLGFPLGFDHTDVPVHGAIDWVCKTHQQIFDEMRSLGRFGPADSVVVVAHPRDGFLGYFDQFGLDPYTLERGDGGLEANNPLFRAVSCDFDAMEIFNAKRFELVHTPTVSEVNDAARCLKEINDAATNAAVRSACPWLTAAPGCQGGETHRAYSVVENGTQRTFSGEPCRWYAAVQTGFDTCQDTDLDDVCKDKARNALTLHILRRMLYRTEEEHAAWRSAAPPVTIAKTAKCSPTTLAAIVAGTTTLTATDEVAPCTQHEGVIEDWFQLLNHGLNITAMGNSDSHGTTLEPGIPRNYIRSSTDDATQIDRREIARNIKAHQVVPSTGPFLEATLNGVGVGGSVDASGGGDLALHIRVQTPSWFGISRIEIFRNGNLEKGIDVTSPAANIVDFDQTVTLPRPTEDSWYVVSAFGLEDDDLLAPVYVTIALGELSLAKITDLAFGQLGVLAALIPSSSQVIDYFPPIPYALTNPIWVDIDGGGFKAPKPRPPFCPVACTPAHDANGDPTASDCAPAVDIDPTDSDPPEVRVCYKNSEVGMPGDGGTCGRRIDGRCGLDLGKTGTQKAPLTVGTSPAFTAPLPLARKRHTLGRYLWNAFRHPMHTHEASHPRH